MLPHKTAVIPENFYDEIIFEITEANRDSVGLYLQRAVIEFCEKSHFWQEDIGPLRVVAATNSFDISPPRGLSVVSIVGVLASGEELVRSADASVPYRYTQKSPFAISVEPHDQLIGSDVSIYAALKPDIKPGDSFKCSEALLDQYRDAIITGAKSLLYKVPRKPWTDMQLAQSYWQLFETASSEALRTQARGFLRIADKTTETKRPFY
jgi:hypothetical protein